MRRARLAAMALVAHPACEFQEGVDAKVPGEALGTYRVLAALEDSTCGDGLAQAPESWEFEVKLSRQGDNLYWLNGREVIAGVVGSRGSFSFATSVITEISPASGGREPCRILRADLAEGTLEGEGVDVPGFRGSLTYQFGADPEGDCRRWVDVPEGFTALPCTVVYATKAHRLPGGSAD